MSVVNTKDPAQTDVPLTPLADDQLSPGVARTVGPQAPPPMKLMAARGLAPLPPQELVVALYQLALTGDEVTKKTATETVSKLPEPVLKVTLSAGLDVRVLDFMTRQLYKRNEALHLILVNRAIDDRTMHFLASVGQEETLEHIAKDEQRLLRSPFIIAALYMNPQIRASTALRAVELAARNNVVVDIPGYEEVVASLKGITLTEADDEKFRKVIPKEGAETRDAVPTEAQEKEAGNLSAEEIEKQVEDVNAEKKKSDKEEEEQKRFEDLPVPFQIRAATLGNAFDRSVAIRSTIRLVAMAAIKSPSITIQEVVKYAANRGLSGDVIAYIANKRDWVQLTSVKLALIYNNKTPLATAMRFLSFLHPRDLKAVSRSRQVPSPLVKGAKELLTKRERK